jgi:hypothetical protein
VIAQVVFGVYLMATFATLSVRYWYATAADARRGPRATASGTSRSWRWTARRGPWRSNDYDRRWRRVVFDGPQVVVFQRIDDSLAHYGAALDAAGRTLALTKGASPTWRASFAVQRSTRSLVLDGEMDGHHIRNAARAGGASTPSAC